MEMQHEQQHQQQRKRGEQKARRLKDNKCVLSGTLGLSGGCTASVNRTTLAVTGCYTLEPA